MSDQLDTKPNAVQVRQEMDANSLVFTDLKQMIINDGTSNAQWSAKALELSPASGGSSSSGTGANSVLVTVNDGALVLQNATVRISEGASVFTAVTGVDGIARFTSIHDASFSVSIAKFGFTFAGATLVVDGNETVTYSMTQIVISPSSPGTKTGYFVTYDPSGVLQAGVTVRMSLKCLPTNHVGHVRDDDVVTVVSDGSGVAQFTGLIPGARYYAWRGNRSRPDSCSTVQIPLTATDGFQIGSISGLD